MRIVIPAGTSVSAIQQAFDGVFKAGGGTVHFEEGLTILKQGLKLRPLVNITHSAGATLQFEGEGCFLHANEDLPREPLQDLNLDLPFLLINSTKCTGILEFCDGISHSRICGRATWEANEGRCDGIVIHGMNPCTNRINDNQNGNVIEFKIRSGVLLDGTALWLNGADKDGGRCNTNLVLKGQFDNFTTAIRIYHGHANTIISPLVNKARIGVHIFGGDLTFSNYIINPYLARDLDEVFYLLQNTMPGRDVKVMAHIFGGLPYPIADPKEVPTFVKAEPIGPATRPPRYELYHPKSHIQDANMTVESGGTDHIIGEYEIGSTFVSTAPMKWVVPLPTPDVRGRLCFLRQYGSEQGPTVISCEKQRIRWKDVTVQEVRLVHQATYVEFLSVGFSGWELVSTNGRPASVNNAIEVS